MKLANSIATSAYAVLLTVLISIPWGAAVGGLLGLLNDDPGSKGHSFVIGGALLAPMLALAFESPFQRLVMLIARLPLMWVFVLPFALLRFIFSVVPAMIAMRIVAATPKDAVVILCPYEGVVRIQFVEKIKIAQETYASGDVIFEIHGDWTVTKNNHRWGRISNDGSLLPSQAQSDRALETPMPARIQEGKLFVDEKAVGVLSPK